MLECMCASSLMGPIYLLKEKRIGDLNFLYHLKQEFGLNPQVLVMPTCLQCLPDGRGIANREKHSMLHLATGFTIVIPYII
jgi:hypothetical protein